MRAVRRRPRGRAIAAVALCLCLGAACESGGGGAADGLGEPASRDTEGGTDAGTPGPDGSGADDAGSLPGGNRAPVLLKIGDKVVAVGQTLSITLSAEDPDADPLTFSMFGQVPLGAAFDKDTHVFTWSPKEDKVGECAYVTFVVSDGVDFDRETVQICVTAQAEPHPPEFVPVASQYPVVGETFKLQLEATDPDGDALTYAFEGASPDGAQLEPASGAFTWTPTAADVGAPVRIGFQVSDGALNATMEVLFFVQDGGTTTGRPPVADPLPPQQAQVGQPLTFTVSATDPDGDPLTWSMRPDTAPAGATFTAGTREFSWTPAEADGGRSYEVTFEVSDGTHNAFLAVDIAVGEVGGGGTCEADRFEPNDASTAPTTLTAGTHASLSICDEAAPAPDHRDLDWYRIAVGAGETLIADVRFAHNQGDIDAQLFAPGQQEPVAVAESSDDDEHVEYAAEAAGDLLLAVYGYTGGAAVSFANDYELEVQLVQAGCVDDAYEENDTQAEAATLFLPELTDGVYGLRVCPDDRDWYRVDLTSGQRVTLLMTFRHADGDLDAYLFGPTGEEALARGMSTDDDEVLVLDPVPASGTYRLVVEGYPRETTTNGYELIAEVGGGGCTAASCPLFQVCDGATGTCVADWCGDGGACPQGYVCRETFCVDTCTSDADCRPDYRCKGFEDGRYCGPVSGDAEPPGSACETLEFCEDEAICWTGAGPGFCAELGCETDSDCPFDALCGMFAGEQLCLVYCFGDSDCLSPALSCRFVDLPAGGEEQACVP